ncbi:MAG TPA: prepilin-type N-terminal cleavage/methylation domain-containing protein [Longimicrobiales bacterium]
MSKQRANDGFTIVEVLIAIVILAVGMLALATTSIVATTQVKIADLKTERSVAVQQAVERLRAIPFAQVAPLPEASAMQFGAFRVWWNETPRGRYLSTITVITEGPGYRAGSGWATAVRDTFVVDITEKLVD